MIYGTTQIDHMQALMKHFNEKYPAIKANYHRQGTTAVYERILREQRAGLFSADVYGGIGGLQAWLLAQKGALTPYSSPERATISNNLKDKDGYWTAAYTVSFVSAFHTRQVTRAEAPRTYEDFLLPKWKGKMWLNEDDIEWYATMFEIMGKEKGNSVHAPSGAAGSALRQRPESRHRTFVRRRISADDRHSLPPHRKAQAKGLSARLGGHRAGL